MNDSYALRSRPLLTKPAYGVSFLRDPSPEDRKRTIDFHADSNDYFGTLATIMGLMADALASGDASARVRCVKTLTELREDLIYLQKSYTIDRKS